MRLPGVQRALLQKLRELAFRLHVEAEGFFDEPENQQLWYNRGYAIGIFNALDALGYGTFIEDRPDSETDQQAQQMQAFEWGQAYQHGISRGEEDTRKVIAPAPSH